jgi:hypothetical protein
MSAKSVGILLTEAGAEAVFLTRRRKGIRVLAGTRAEAPGPLWTGDHSNLKPLFKKLAKSLPSDARRADVEHRVAVPDPLISEDRMVFRDLPKDEGEARELILWRIARERRRPAESLACAFQVERIEAGEARVLVRIADRAVVDAVLDAAGSVGFFPRRVDGWAGFGLNRAAHGSLSGARLWSNGDWWTLMCWTDEGEGDALIHSEWIGGGLDTGATAEKATRLARSFALNAGVAKLRVDLEVPGDLVQAFVRAPIREGSTLELLEADRPVGGAECVALLDS